MEWIFGKNLTYLVGQQTRSFSGDRLDKVRAHVPCWVPYLVQPTCANTWRLIQLPTKTHLRPGQSIGSLVHELEMDPNAETLKRLSRMISNWWNGWRGFHCRKHRQKRMKSPKYHPGKRGIQLCLYKVTSFARSVWDSQAAHHFLRGGSYVVPTAHVGSVSEPCCTRVISSSRSSKF